MLNCLENFDKLVFRTTNRHFHGIIPITVKSACSRAGSSLEMDLYGCYVCLRLRRASHFADNMRKVKRRRGGSKPYARFCSDCGLDSRSRPTRYTRGDIIVIECKVFIKCWYRRYGVVVEQCVEGTQRVCICYWEVLARQQIEKECE